MAALTIHAGGADRDFIAERLTDGGANRGESDTDDPRFRERCRKALLRGFRLMGPFRNTEDAPRGSKGPLFLETPRFGYSEETGSHEEEVKAIGEVSIGGVVYTTSDRDLTEILADGALDEFDLAADRARWSLYTHTDAAAKGSRLFRVTAVGVERIGAQGQGLAGGYQELQYLNMVMSGMEAAIHPQ